MTIRPGRLALAAGLIVLMATPTVAEGPIEARQRLMVSLIQATKIPRAMAGGVTPLDPRAVKDAVKQVLEATAALPALFPNGSIDDSSQSLPAIFTDRANFEARFLDLEKAAVQMAFATQQGPEEFAFAYSEYAAVCDSCHAKYRKPE